MKTFSKALLLIVSAFAVISCGVVVTPAGTSAGYFPSKSSSKHLRVATYNVGTFTKSGQSSLEMVAAMMQESGADIVCLQELDNHCTRTGKTFQIKDFAEAMGGWNYYFSPAMPFQGGTYGIGIVSRSKLRVRDSWSLDLPKGKGAEPRVLSVVDFGRFVVATTHLDHTSEPARLAQVQKLTRALEQEYYATGKTVILCGDMNAKPGSRTMRELEKSWTVVSPLKPTYSSDRPRECIDYILVLGNGSGAKVGRNGVCTKFISGIPTVASDHLPVYADIKP